MADIRPAKKFRTVEPSPLSFAQCFSSPSSAGSDSESTSPPLSTRPSSIPSPISLPSLTDSSPSHSDDSDRDENSEKFSARPNRRLSSISEGKLNERPKKIPPPTDQINRISTDSSRCGCGFALQNFSISLSDVLRMCSNPNCFDQLINESVESAIESRIEPINEKILDDQKNVPTQTLPIPLPQISPTEFFDISPVEFSDSFTDFSFELSEANSGESINEELLRHFAKEKF